MYQTNRERVLERIDSETLHLNKETLDWINEQEDARMIKVWGKKFESSEHLIQHEESECVCDNPDYYIPSGIVAAMYQFGQCMNCGMKRADYIDYERKERFKPN